MCKKQVALTVLSCAAICAALFGEAQAQLVKLPAVPFTVADCHPGDHWGSSPSHGGLLRCLTNNPPPAPTCPAGSTQTSAPVWNGEAWSQPVCAVIPPPAPPSPPPGHVVVATATTNSCGTLGAFNTYADGTYDASNPDWSQSFSGTWDQMFSNGAAYMNQNYARYYQPMYIPQPSDPNTATQYLSRVFFVNNPWACGGGVG
ncbi:hypothetical protein K6V72_27420 [Ralstonia insidiosa]|jgi:hypothetical protein|uniref:Secreted protein n=7 Tax=Ralstonia TaxID=48736 RepID=A0ABN9KP98_9RALS|nr:hypothetical protein A9Y76_28825 [Ralstonia insidiosa]EGY60036.1 hypothetical protein HMPREF0989_04752 [Ralstonia sp. 5_2_56FAA]ENZ75044.1 hypothetical protein OR214_05018 [Ralstonia pickettii OR214]MBA4233052.1 hypothetical protein [Ralstonia sp.]MBA9848290.1 hypothetical protein [Ralstonia pickettii]MBE3066663.1 hypothetical protein [Chloroflexota bacterium]MDH6645279.1 hypothetical protein [Ralstonia sp. GP73]NPT51292.1 hypothetical protein [Ralstonia sp. 3N]OYU20549.1 MAG: hypothetic